MAQILNRTQTAMHFQWNVINCPINNLTSATSHMRNHTWYIDNCIAHYYSLSLSCSIQFDALAPTIFNLPNQYTNLPLYVWCTMRMYRFYHYLIRWIQGLQAEMVDPADIHPLFGVQLVAMDSIQYHCQRSTKVGVNYALNLTQSQTKYKEIQHNHSFIQCSVLYNYYK